MPDGRGSLTCACRVPTLALMAAADPPFPPVPGYAWDWLQRSRPVLSAAAVRLTGGVPSAGFVDRLREDFATDAFTQQVLIDVVAEVAFAGRVPTANPAAATWDRGLRWWAAALAGVSPSVFDEPAPTMDQGALFDLQAQPEPLPRRRGRRRRSA